MAKEDLELLVQRYSEFEECKKTLNQIIELCGENKNSYLSEIELIANKSIEDMTKKLSILSKEGLCPHISINKGIYDGHDSHYRYYKDVCRDCGKILLTYEL